MRILASLYAAAGSLAILTAAPAQARDINDYPVCREIRSEILQMVPRYYTPKDVVDLVERCMTWQDNMRDKGYTALQGPSQAA